MGEESWEQALRWSVRDDFGVSRVVVEVTENGETREYELRRPLEVPRELDGALRVRDSELAALDFLECLVRGIVFQTTHLPTQYASFLPMLAKIS